MLAIVHVKRQTGIGSIARANAVSPGRMPERVLTIPSSVEA